MQSVAQEVAAHTTKIAPPAIISATSFMGVGWDNWVYIATLGYIGLQSWFLIYRWWHEHVRNRRDKDKE